MDQDLDLESRLRRYAEAFRREANPPENLMTDVVDRGWLTRRANRVGRLRTVAIAAVVLVAGLVIAYGALQLRMLSRSSPTSPIIGTTPKIGRAHV